MGFHQPFPGGGTEKHHHQYEFCQMGTRKPSVNHHFPVKIAINPKFWTTPKWGVSLCKPIHLILNTIQPIFGTHFMSGFVWCDLSDLVLGEGIVTNINHPW